MAEMIDVVRRSAVATLVAVLFFARPLGGQQMCGGVNHYRWKEKVEAPGSHTKADTVKVNYTEDQLKVAPDFKTQESISAEQPQQPASPSMPTSTQ